MSTVRQLLNFEKFQRSKTHTHRSTVKIILIEIERTDNLTKGTVDWGRGKFLCSKSFKTFNVNPVSDPKLTPFINVRQTRSRIPFQYDFSNSLVIGYKLEIFKVQNRRPVLFEKGCSKYKFHCLKFT